MNRKCSSSFLASVASGVDGAKTWLQAMGSITPGTKCVQKVPNLGGRLRAPSPQKLSVQFIFSKVHIVCNQQSGDELWWSQK